MAGRFNRADIELFELVDVTEDILQILREALDLVALQVNAGKARDILNVFFSNTFLAFCHNSLCPR